MRLLVNFCLAAAAACCLSFAAAGAAGADDGAAGGASAPVDGTFFDQVFEGWKQLIEAYGRGYAVKIDVQLPKSRQSIQYDFYYHRVYQLYRSYDGPRSFIAGVNNEYRFYLILNRKGKYKLYGFGRENLEDTEPFAGHWFLPGCNLELGKISIERLVRDPTFKIAWTADTTDPDSGEKIKAIAFEADFVDPKSNRNRIHHGRILFLPDSYWLIKEYVIQYDLNNVPSQRFVADGKFSYQTVDGLPFADKCEEHVSLEADPDNPLVTAIAQTTDVERREPVAEQFFPKYYGVSVPFLLTKKGHMLILAEVLVIVVLLGWRVYKMFRRRFSRENRSAEDSSSETA